MALRQGRAGAPRAAAGVAVLVGCAWACGRISSTDEGGGGSVDAGGSGDSAPGGTSAAETGGTSGAETRGTSGSNTGGVSGGKTGGASGADPTGGSAGEALSCEYRGQTYADGERFPAGDGCNSCTCFSGEAVCTFAGCFGGGGGFGASSGFGADSGFGDGGGTGGTTGAAGAAGSSESAECPASIGSCVQDCFDLLCIGDQPTCVDGIAVCPGDQVLRSTCPEESCCGPMEYCCDLVTGKLVRNPCDDDGYRPFCREQAIGTDGYECIPDSLGAHDCSTLDGQPCAGPAVECWKQQETGWTLCQCSGLETDGGTGRWSCSYSAGP